MTLSLSLDNLTSRQVRNGIVGFGGVRRLAVNATTTHEAEEGGLLGVYNAINKFGNSLMVGTLKLLWQGASFSWAAFWGATVQAYHYIQNFNWNATDAQLDQQIKDAEIALRGAQGSLAGQSLGFAVCGLIPTATIAVFNEPLALHMMSELGEEAAEEIAQSLASLVRLQISATARRGFIALFKNHRSLLRSAVRGFAQGLVSVGIFTQEAVDKMEKKRNEPWTLAEAMDDSIDSIKDPGDRAYAENFWDEFEDSCIEAGFIIAGAADGYFAQTKAATQSVLGREHIIEIEPIRNGEATP